MKEYSFDPCRAGKCLLNSSDVHTLSNVKTHEDEVKSVSVGLSPDAFPEAKSSKTGVSVSYTPSADKRWYVFRASYHREDRASDYMVEDGTYTYIAKKLVEKYVRGKRHRYYETLIPNLVFAYTTAEKAEEYVHDTPPLSFLSYYYNHFEKDGLQRNPPLVVPGDEMDRYVRATSSRNKHLLFVTPSQCHYKSGDMVVVTDGAFQGVEGRVARVAGQQRVVVSLSKIGLVSTAYIPTAFIKKL